MLRAKALRAQQIENAIDGRALELLGAPLVKYRVDGLLNLAVLRAALTPIPPILANFLLEHPNSALVA